MSINDVDESRIPVETKSEPVELKTPDDTPDASVSSEIELNAITDALDIKADDSNYTDEIDWLLNYAKDQAEENTPEGLKWAIRELETKLGTPPFLEDRVKFMGRYAYLFMEGKKTNKELQKMTRGIDVSI